MAARGQPFTDAAWLYVIGDEKRAGHALVSLSVNPATASRWSMMR
jgi:hypothetical protein